MSGRKYEELIKHRQAKLDQIRSERKQLQLDKAVRDAEKLKEETTCGNIDTIEDLNKICASFDIPPMAEVQAKSPISKPEIIGPKATDKTVDTSNRDISKKLQKLSVFHTEITDIQPKIISTSAKSTQTNISRPPALLILDKYDDIEDEYMSQGGFGSKLPPGCMSPGLPKLHFIEPALTPMEHINEETKEGSYSIQSNENIITEIIKECRMILNKLCIPCESVTELTEEEKLAIISSTSFQNVLSRLGRKMENVISKNVDITKDYVRSTGYGDDEKSRGRVSLNRTFYDSQWSKNRCITGLDWSTYYPELLAASYHSNEDESLEPEGIVVVWNTMFQKPTPEHVFHCPSAVMSVCFAKSNPNVTLGGTYSGQIVVWDKRSPTPIPVQSTSLNCGAHVQPIHSLRIIGSEDSHSIVSISSDGKLCTWNLDMLSEPVDILTLEKEQKRPVAVTGMAFLANEYNDLVIGSEDGCVYMVSRFGLSEGVCEKFEKHEGPITGISSHYNPLRPEFGHLFLTSSVDSTIKLWSSNEAEPLYTFKDNCDYVMDVAWSPINPALFAAIDGSGRLDFRSFEPWLPVQLVRTITSESRSNRGKVVIIKKVSRFGLSEGVCGKFEKHEGPITGISSHYNPLWPEFGHLFLTSSVDSTIKLWSSNEAEPLYTFKDNCDYVMDVAWSPINPALFAAIDGSGRLDLWNLNMYTEEPTVSLDLSGQPGLNRISWMPNGQRIAVGDIDGKLYLYDIIDNLAQPLPDECSAFENTLQIFKQKLLYK